MDEDRQEQLRDEARDRIENMPAETALGNADPQGPSDQDPTEWEAEHQDPTR